MKNYVLLGALLFAVSCTEGGLADLSAFSESAGTVADSGNRDFYPNDTLIVQARVQFRDQNYGKAHTLFKRAVDVAPSDPAALLGYAASLDMLRRFDQADAAYRKLQPMIGNRIEFHNNFGYSHLLRGNLQVARKHFLIAYEMNPANPVTANNLELLRNSVNYQKRSPGDIQGI